MVRDPINPIGPTKINKVEVSEPAQYAAGTYGVKVALEHAIKEMGPARAMTTLAKMNKKNGFDCPGCAWPDPDDKRSVLGEYCENGAKALAEEATLKKVGRDFFAQHSIQEISNWTDYKIGKSGRITEPMVLLPNENYYQPIEWDKAYNLIAAHLNNLDSPNEAVFYTSGRSSNEAAFLYGLFCRAYGTNNMPDCSNMCHESSGVALSQTLGIGKGSVTLNDLHEAEVIMVIGQNPGTNHPRMLSALEKCKEKGGKIISINPLREAGLRKFRNPQKVSSYFGKGTLLTDVYLQVRINEDIPLLQALSKEIYDRHKFGTAFIDESFIAEKTEGFNSFIKHLDRNSTEDLIGRAGIDIKDFYEAVDILAPAKKIIICWAMGLTQHKNGVNNIKECVNLLLMKGSIGKPGAGTCPVRGHSNVQGDRTVGIVHESSVKLSKALKERFNIIAPSEKGLDTVACIQAMHKGEAKVFMSLGGNFVSAASDTRYTSAAIQNCELTVSVSTKLNRTHVTTGKTSIILPTLGRSERDVINGKSRSVTVENSMGKVHSSVGSLKPASDNLRSEVDIVCEIAKRTLNQTTIPWDNYQSDYGEIRNEISQIIDGFQDYNKRVENGSEFYLPNNARKGDFSKLSNGRAKFTVCPLPDHALADDEFLLMTVRSHDQFNTTIYGLHDRYRGIHNGRRVLFMNEKDMLRLGIERLQVVHLESHYASGVRRAENFQVIPYDIPTKNLGAYFPETNVLVPIEEYADGSRTPISKSIRVKVVNV